MSVDGNTLKARIIVQSLRLVYENIMALQADVFNDLDLAIKIILDLEKLEEEATQRGDRLTASMHADLIDYIHLKLPATNETLDGE